MVRHEPATVYLRVGKKSEVAIHEGKITIA